jgi:hypothetical protein
MLGIYNDSFLDFLKQHLGEPIKVRNKNIVAKCPFCSSHHVSGKEHLHLYISTEIPIFNCFQAGCPGRGNISKLIKYLQGHDISDKFIDKELLKESIKRVKVFADDHIFEVKLPDLKLHVFPNKLFYLKKRLKFSNIDITTIYGLVFDINAFLEINEIPINENLFRLKDFLHSNFIGFVTKHNSTLILRNIDETSDFRYFKVRLQNSKFLDYYQIYGSLPESNQIVLSEGIFDIMTEQIFDSLNINKSTRLFASALSSKYDSLLKSIVFHEQIFNPNVIILSDNGIELDYYKKLKKYNNHIINTLCVYYNKSGKDFNDTPISPVKYVI